ncbi:MAG TPA: helix-turn-helix domain-containing protein [Methyloceanibacter sp.]|nr:helix-turn-helix domain-containing protein [Methyloceanibacter sp.]
MNGGIEYLRARDIAELTGVSLRTVRRWIADGAIPSTRVGGARLVAKAELQILFSPLSQATHQSQKDAN